MSYKVVAANGRIFYVDKAISPKYRCKEHERNSEKILAAKSAKKSFRLPKPS